MQPMGYWTVAYRLPNGELRVVSGSTPDSVPVDVESARADEMACAKRDMLANPHPDYIPGVTPLYVLRKGELNNLVFRSEWNAQETLWQELLSVLYPDILAELNNPDGRFDRFASVEVLRVRAGVKLHELGLSEPCSRCGGSGRHSRCDRFGSTCFLCGTGLKKGVPGRGYTMPKLTQKLIRSAEEKMKGLTV